MVLSSLQNEIKILKLEQKAFQAQTRLFEIFIEMAKSSSELELLKGTMQKTLEVAKDMTHAQKGSIFLLNENGTVTDSLLTREEISDQKRSALIGQVLDDGLAGWVKKNLETGVIHETRVDKRWVTLPGQPYSVRSALSIPILKNNALFGILTLLHDQPNHFDKESVKIMEMTADQMALAIENTRMYVQLDEYHKLKRQAIEKDLMLAKEVQQSFLPEHLPKINGYFFDAVNAPALKVGGDFYNFFPVSDGKLGIVLGDVSGKGIAAALFMARLTSDLQFHALILKEPAKLLEKINNLLCKRAKRGMFVTLVYIILDIEKQQICLSNAGHLFPVYSDNSGVDTLGSETLKGLPLGILPDTKFEQETFNLKKGAGVTLYTDGVIEAKNNNKELFGTKRLLSIINNCREEQNNLIKQISDTVDRFAQDQGRSDDLTLLHFKVV